MEPQSRLPWIRRHLSRRELARAGRRLLSVDVKGGVPSCDVPNAIAGWDPGYGLDVAPDTTCHPKPVTTWWNNGRLGGNSLTIVSLGPMSCPEAYSTARTSVKDQYSTMVACCPM